MGPCFLNDMDLIGAATPGNLLFGKTTWVSGHKNTQPLTVETSSYDVMDELINFYLDKEKFPALEAVVFAGHSAGGQMTQRYAALRKMGTNEERIHYWVRSIWLIISRRSLTLESCRWLTLDLLCGSPKTDLCPMLPARELTRTSTASMTPSQHTP